jgi:hypothetical protein
MVAGKVCADAHTERIQGNKKTRKEAAADALSFFGIMQF